MKEFLNKVVNDADKRNQYVNTSTDFTRKRGLPLSDLILLLINLLKRSLSIELQDYFTHMGSVPITKSAFCQQRKKLKAKFFQDWNNVLISGFYQYADAKVKVSSFATPCRARAMPQKRPEKEKSESFIQRHRPYRQINKATPCAAGFLLPSASADGL